MNTLAQPQLAGIWRRLAALAYEAVLLFAIVFIAGYLFVALAGQTPQGMLHWFFYLFLYCVEKFSHTVSHTEITYFNKESQQEKRWDGKNGLLEL